MAYGWVFIMRFLSVPDRLPVPFFHITRHAGINSGCLRLSTAASCRFVMKSTRNSHILCKNRAEKHLNLYCVMKMVSVSGDATSHSNLSVLTSGSLCKKEVKLSMYIKKKIPYRTLSSSLRNTAANKDDMLTSDSDTDKHIRPALDSVIASVPAPTHVDIVPGKGPPPEPPVDCCMSGCANCVWIQYAEELKQYYSLEKGNEKAKEAIEKIENPGLQMFLKLELGLL